MRYPSIDILRMIAIIVMVLVHFSENLAGYTLPITGLGAPLFAFLSGVSYYLWAEGQRLRGRSDEELSKVSVRRGLFVFGVGFAFNILVWLPSETFNWDVLTFIGSALLVLNVERRQPTMVIVIFAITALLVSPVLRIQTDYASYWQNGYYDPDFTLTDVLCGYLVCGYFPIFPWITFSLAGFVTARQIFGIAAEADEQEPDEPTCSPWSIVCVGVALLAVALLSLFVRPYLPQIVSLALLGGWTMFPTSLEYALTMIGTALVLLGLLHRYVDRNPRKAHSSWLLDIAKTFSQYSLTIYVLHHLVHLWPLWIYAVAMGNDDLTTYWMQATTIPVALALAALFLVICFFTLRWIGPDRRFGIEAWMRWVCD